MGYRRSNYLGGAARPAPAYRGGRHRRLKAPQFVPAVVEAARRPERAGRGQPRRAACATRRSRICGLIEVKIEEDMTVRIGRGAEAGTVAAFLRALKALARDWSDRCGAGAGGAEAS